MGCPPSTPFASWCWCPWPLPQELQPSHHPDGLGWCHPGAPGADVGDGPQFGTCDAGEMMEEVDRNDGSNCWQNDAKC